MQNRSILWALSTLSFAFLSNTAFAQAEIELISPSDSHRDPVVQYMEKQMIIDNARTMSGRNGDVVAPLSLGSDQLVDSKGNVYDSVGNGDYIDQNGRMATEDGAGGMFFLPE